MNSMAQIRPREVPLSRKSAGYRGGNNVDIVGVPSSILGTPTIQPLDNQGFPAQSTKCPAGSTNLMSRFWVGSQVQTLPLRVAGIFGLEGCQVSQRFQWGCVIVASVVSAAAANLSTLFQSHMEG